MNLNFRASDVRRVLSEFISDPHNIQLCRNILADEAMLKASKVSNWRSSPQSIPDTAVEGALFGFMYAKREEEKRDLFGTAPLSLAKVNRRDLEITGLWADSVWHVLQLEPDGFSKVWRRWNGLRPVFHNKPAWLTHSSRIELPENAALDSINLSGNSEIIEPFYEDQGNKSQANITFSKEVIDRCNTGYQFETFGSFAANAPTGGEGIEFFAGQSTVPCCKSYIIVSVPTSWIHSENFASTAFGLSFAPVAVTNPIQHVRKIMNLGVKTHEANVDLRTFSTWMQKEAVRENIRLDEAKRFERELEGLALTRETHTNFIAEFSFPNPLSYQAIFWRLPHAK